MLRSSKHILKYQTDYKNEQLVKLFEIYESELKFYIDLIISGKLPLKSVMSSKLIPNNLISHSNWKQNIYKMASQIIRLSIKK